VRLLLVGAGAATSTADVEAGYVEAFAQLGPDVRFYGLSQRLDAARDWLRRLWKMRGAVPADKPGWPDAIYRGSVEALEMALRFEVDWVVIVSGMFFHPNVVAYLRRAGIRTAVILTESPYEDARQARLASLVDVCWTNERTSVERLRLANPRTRYLPHAFDPHRHTIFEPPLEDVPAHDVIFVGSGFAERIELLEQIDWTGIDLGLYGYWSLLGSRSKLRRYVRGGPVPNTRAVALYRRAQVGLNLFRTSVAYGRQAPRIAYAESANPRTFELAACGVFQVSDFRPEIGDLFDSSIPTATGPAEMESLIRRALADPAWRQACANRSRRLVAPHTFAARAAQALADLEQFEAAPEQESERWQSNTVARTG
jgi:spore maturation protein CgeB